MQKNFNKLITLILFFLIVFLFLFSGVNIKNTVLAFTAKSLNDQLTVADWNGLADDFLAKSGGIMSGDININNNKITNIPTPTSSSDNKDVANKEYVDTKFSAGSGITNLYFTEGIKMVCGTSGTGGWTTVNNGSPVFGVYYITRYVDTSSAGFIDDHVIYFTSLNGEASTARSTGVQNLYQPRKNGFSVSLAMNDINENINDSLNNINGSWAWEVRWCGIGKIN